MKCLALIIGFVLVIGLISGCAQQPADDSRAIAGGEGNTDTATPTEEAADTEIQEELDNTYVDDEDLDVGELY